MMGVWRRTRHRVEFGCEYCADDHNRFYGHLTQIASDKATQAILLRCPRCGAYYENTPRGADKTRRPSSAEAHQRYAIEGSS
jgi:hypothetical protein